LRESGKNSGDSGKPSDPGRVAIVEGDVLDAKTLGAAMRGQDVVSHSSLGVSRW